MEMNRLVAIEDEIGPSKEIRIEVNQVVEWGCMALNIPTPDVHYFTHAELPEEKVRAMIDGKTAFPLGQRAGGFYVQGEHGIWLSTTLRSYNNHLEWARVILHELRHYAIRLRLRGKLAYDYMAHEEDAYGWSYHAVKEYALDLKEQAEKDRWERAARLRQIEREL